MMKKDVKISIIVPVYNLEKQIDKCAQSILNQSYQNIEVIFVDDGSTDNSRACLDNLKQLDSRVVVIEKDNGGVTSARLEGIKAATGDYIGFVDGDDWIETNMYEVLLQNALKHKADLSHCGYQIDFEDGRINYFYNTKVTEVHDTVTGIKELLSGKKVEPALVNKLFCKEVFDDLIKKDLMDKTIKINEDLLMNFYLFKNTKTSVFCDFPFYHYVARPGSASKQKLNNHSIFDPIKVRRIIIQLADDDLKEMVQGLYITACINAYNTILRTCYWEYKDELKTIKKYIKDKKKWRYGLEKRPFIVSGMILYGDFIYRIIYRVYFKMFMENRFE